MVQSDRFVSFGAVAGRRPNGLVAGLLWLCGAVAAAAAMTAGALLAVFAALAVAIIAVVGGVVVFLTGLAMRARGAGRRDRRSGDVIEARKVGGTWVAYGWDRAGR